MKSGWSTDGDYSLISLTCQLLAYYHSDQKNHSPLKESWQHSVIFAVKKRLFNQQGLKKGLQSIAQIASQAALRRSKIKLTVQLREMYAAREYSEHLLRATHGLEASTDNNLTKHTMSDGYALPNVQSIQQRLTQQNLQIAKLKAQLASADIQLGRIKSQSNWIIKVRKLENSFKYHRIPRNTSIT